MPTSSSVGASAARFFSVSSSWSPQTSSEPSPSHRVGESVAVLGGIVLIRTFLSFSLQLEVTGALPWQQRSVAAADKSPARPTE